MRTAPLALLLLLAGCAGTPTTSVPPDGSDPVLVIADGGGGANGISVADALGHRAADDLVLVTGALFVDADGTVRLCDAIAESFPPQCGGERIEVQGRDLATIEGLHEEGGLQWAESVILFGSVE
jgi:hypothetical protein